MSRSKLTQWRARHVGFIFQMYNLIPVLTAFQNVELPLLLTRLSKAERRKHVETALSVVGLSRSHEPFSAPAFRRTGAARDDCARHCFRSHVLAVRRADRRPGPQERGRNHGADRRLVKEYRKTVLMVTHDPARGGARADMTLHLEKGVLVEGDRCKGVPAEVGDEIQSV